MWTSCSQPRGAAVSLWTGASQNALIRRSTFYWGPLHLTLKFRVSLQDFSHSLRHFMTISILLPHFTLFSHQNLLPPLKQMFSHSIILYGSNDVTYFFSHSTPHLIISFFYKKLSFQNFFQRLMAGNEACLTSITVRNDVLNLLWFLVLWTPKCLQS